MSSFFGKQRVAKGVTIGEETVKFIMHAIEITKPGGPEALTLSERPRPTPGPDEVLIKVVAAGVNRPDVVQRMGFYAPPPGASDIPGLEVCGIVESVGDAAGVAPGARVMALVSGGGYAEFVVAKAAHVLNVPEGLSELEAACFPETSFTVWANVFEIGALKPDDTLFLHGATSGIGTMAVQMANAAGASVYGTAGTPEKCATAENLGFAKCFNYRTDDWCAAMIELGKADIVLDMVGGDYVPKNLSLLKRGGRHISIGVQAGITTEVNLFDMMRRQLTVTGSVLRGRSDGEKARLTGAVARQVMPWVLSGAVKPLVNHVFPLEEAHRAHKLMESGDLVGKIALTL